MNTVIEKPKKLKKLTLKDLNIESFITSDIRKMMLFTNEACNEVGYDVYAAQTGMTQCKANGGCVDGTVNTACYTHADGCNATANCATVGCQVTVGCTAIC